MLSNMISSHVKISYLITFLFCPSFFDLHMWRYHIFTCEDIISFLSICYHLVYHWLSYNKIVYRIDQNKTITQSLKIRFESCSWLSNNTANRYNMLNKTKCSNRHLAWFLVLNFFNIKRSNYIAHSYKPLEFLFKLWYVRWQAGLGILK